MFRTLLTMALFALPTAAFAQDDPATDLAADDVPSALTGEVSLNGSRTTGNTDTAQIGTTIRLNYDLGEWDQTLNISGDYGREDGERVQQRYRIGYKADRDFSDRIYGFGTVDYYQDDFGPYKRGYFAGAGVGWHAVETSSMIWDLETGLGYREQKSRETENVPPGVAFFSVDEIAARAFSDFGWEINDRVELTNITELLTSSSDTYIWNDTALSAELFGGLAARLSYRIDYHTDVPVGRVKTDTIARAGLVYSID